ncbi:hypothetical protein EW146_g3507 [Bondarzewia mesenterica]|uniref:Peptidase M64 N-terminal domain-containing protein n=1 Tax=Bondarzewia mesenterica TaxID=1095465 RepID=A0A4S4LXK9_9AGAM|nr:hypothetical protein EW146_g3507 [Bondarzewia mesenterica]
MESIRIFAHSEDVLWGRIGPTCEGYDKLDFSAFVRPTAPSAFRSDDSQTILSTLPVLGQPGDVFELPLDVQRISGSGSSPNRVDLTFFSDGYLASEKDKFIADVKRLVVEISVNQTFQAVAPLLNFWAAFTPSNEVTSASLPFFHSTFVVDLTALRRAASASAGYRKSEGPSSHDADSIPVLNMNISTPFGLYRDGTELRALYYSKPDVARAACNSLGDRCNYPILIGNDPLYGGLGGEFTTITSSIVNAALILRHELGHSVIGVGEEYDGGFAYFGVDAGFNASEPMPWAHWLSPTNSSSGGLPRVERVVMPLQDYAWALLNTTTPWSASFNSSGTYSRYLVRFSLSGLLEKGDLSVLLDGDDLGWTPKEGLGVDRYFYDIYRDDALSEGEHVVEFVLKNGEREGIAQMCSVEFWSMAMRRSSKPRPDSMGYSQRNFSSRHFSSGTSLTSVSRTRFSETNETTYRPTNEDCLMRLTTRPDFCKVCIEGLWSSLLSRVDLIDGLETQCQLDSDAQTWKRALNLRLVPIGQFREEPVRAQESYTIEWTQNGVQLAEFANQTVVVVDDEEALGVFEVAVKFATEEVSICMAITATAQSALLPTPSWDETIVPTLRKRLENESRALAKRLSVASITSDDPSAPNYYRPASNSPHKYYKEPANNYPYRPTTPKPSGIPRPSLQAARPSDGRTTPNSARSRSASPATPVTPGRPLDAKRTRIPVARARAGSTSSYAPSPANGISRSESRAAQSTNGQYAPMAEATERAADEVRTPQMPAYAMDDMDPRPSADSEERPFEHWYRGEVARNGGVGEMRVGRRMEMLEIASYGHTVAAQARPDRWSPMRWRAGSIGERGSFYMEDDLRLRNSERVMDEAPPPDLVGGTDSETEEDEEPVPRSKSAMENGSLTPTSHEPERAPSQAMQKDIPATRLPKPGISRQASDSPRTPTPTPSLSPSTSYRGTTDSSNTPRSPSRNTSSPAARSSPSPHLIQSPKRRAKSPAEARDTSKKTKTKQPPVTQPRRVKQVEYRRSIAEYPDPGDGDISNAIPTWTQPVPPGGNWDEVVIPVVARKKGLDGHYTKADGSPQAKQNGDETPEPAPGTFGYDYSKYRPGQNEEIPMSEFGHPPEPVDERMQEVPPTLTQAPKTVRAPDDEVYEQRVRTMRMQPPPSPAPFARYRTDVTDEGGPVPTIPDVALATQMSIERGRQQEDEDDGGGGCCKCVIM